MQAVKQAFLKLYHLDDTADLDKMAEEAWRLNISSQDFWGIIDKLTDEGFIRRLNVGKEKWAWAESSKIHDLEGNLGLYF